MMQRGLTWVVKITDDDGLSNTGFTLSETTSTSGIFTGTFQIPANYCTSNATVSTTTGKDLGSQLDYSDASGTIEVGCFLSVQMTAAASDLCSVYPATMLIHPLYYDTSKIDETLAIADSSNSQYQLGSTILYALSGSGI